MQLFMGYHLVNGADIFLGEKKRYPHEVIMVNTYKVPNIWISWNPQTV